MWEEVTLRGLGELLEDGLLVQSFTGVEPLGGVCGVHLLLSCLIKTNPF